MSHAFFSILIPKNTKKVVILSDLGSAGCREHMNAYQGQTVQSVPIVVDVLRCTWDECVTFMKSVEGPVLKPLLQPFVLHWIPVERLSSRIHAVFFDPIVSTVHGCLMTASCHNWGRRNRPTINKGYQGPLWHHWRLVLRAVSSLPKVEKWNLIQLTMLQCEWAAMQIHHFNGNRVSLNGTEQGSFCPL